MRIGICDDSQLDREMIRDLLDLYFADKSIAYQVDLYGSGVDVIHEFQEGTAYDIVFLDIYMEKDVGDRRRQGIKTVALCRGNCLSDGHIGFRGGQL